MYRLMCIENQLYITIITCLHTLPSAVAQVAMLTNCTPKALFVDRGYRGIKVPGVTIWRSGQKRGVTPSIKKTTHRRSAIEPAIGHMMNDGRLRRNWLKGALGDALHAMPCCVAQVITYG